MSNFDLQIAEWYRQTKRDLPWRHTTDPYFIWISEVILQQTRVEQGISYYYRFIESFPTVHHLAKADLQMVLNLWQGLGYYSRARNLHATAQYISIECKGKFPESYVELLKLKGIGPYIAAAIASFAFKECVPVIDGNVYRVLSRHFDIDTPINSTKGMKEFKSLAEILINKKNPDIHNQAIMEFGALQCTPNNPNCEGCILQSSCLAFCNKTIKTLPVKLKKQPPRNRYFHFLILNCDGQTFIQQRHGKDIWEALYQFPLIETEHDTELSELQRTYQSEQFKISTPVTHLLSHQRLIARFYHIQTKIKNVPDDWIKIPFQAIQDYPIPRLIDKYLEALGK